MSPYYFAPGRLFGVEHFQVLGSSTRLLWFWFRAHFVVLPLHFVWILLKHGSKNIATMGSATVDSGERNGLLIKRIDLSRGAFQRVDSLLPNERESAARYDSIQLHPNYSCDSTQHPSRL